MVNSKTVVIQLSLIDARIADMLIEKKYSASEIDARIAHIFSHRSHDAIDGEAQAVENVIANSIISKRTISVNTTENSSTDIQDVELIFNRSESSFILMVMAGVEPESAALSAGISVNSQIVGSITRILMRSSGVKLKLPDLYDTMVDKERMKNGI